MRKLLCLIILFMVTGCASTDLTGYVDPAYQHHNLGKTIICIKGADMGEVFEAEEKISLMLAEKSFHNSGENLRFRLVSKNEQSRNAN